MRSPKMLKDEIGVLNQNISKFDEMSKQGKLTNEDYDDYHQMIGWRDALAWVLTEVP